MSLANHTSGQTCYIVVRSCSIMLHSTMAYSCFMRRIRCTSEYLPGIRRGKNCPLPRFITWGNNRVCVYTVHVCIYDYKYMQHVYIVIDVIDICTYFDVAQVTHWSSFFLVSIIVLLSEPQTFPGFARLNCEFGSQDVFLRNELYGFWR